MGQCLLVEFLLIEFGETEIASSPGDIYTLSLLPRQATGVSSGGPRARQLKAVAVMRFSPGAVGEPDHSRNCAEATRALSVDTGEVMRMA